MVVVALWIVDVYAGQGWWGRSSDIDRTMDGVGATVALYFDSQFTFVPTIAKSFL